MLRVLDQPASGVPFGVHCSEVQASTSPSLDAARTQSPVWTDSDNRTGPGSGRSSVLGY